MLPAPAVWTGPGVLRRTAPAPRSRPFRCSAAALALLALPLLPSSLQSQGVEAQADSLTAQARLAGRTAADREAVWPFFGLAVAPAAAVGFFGTIGASEGFGFGDPETGLAALGAAGLLLTIGVARWTAAPPGPEDRRLVDRPSSYQRAFRDAYTQRLRQRRGRAILWGGLTGAAAGLGFLLLVAISVD